MNAVPATASPEPADPALPAIDAAALAQLRELDPQGSSGIVTRVLQTYQRSLARFVSDVEAARAAGDIPTLGRLTHTLRSSSASVGALQLSALCRQVESQVRDRQLDDLPVLLDALLVESSRVQVELADMLGDNRHTLSTTR
jgi:hypothetical protein